MDIMNENTMNERMIKNYENGIVPLINENNYNNNNLKKEIIDDIRLLEVLIKDIINKTSNDKEIENIFYEQLKLTNFEITKYFLEKIEEKISFKINENVYYKIFSYILILLNFDKISKNKEMLIRKFIKHTPEYLITFETIKQIFREKKLNYELDETTLIQIADIVMGITLNNFENDYFEYWVNEDIIVDDIVKSISSQLNLNLNNDKIFHNGILHHIKLAIYRIKNNIHISNSVYDELLFQEKNFIKIVKNAIYPIENIIGISFTNYEIACIVFQLRAAIKRLKNDNMPRVVLICGLGFGTSRILEQSLQNNFNLDIIDVLPYYLADDIIHNYRRVQYILTTIDLNRKYHIPILKLNPILQKEDFSLLEKIGIKKK